MALCPLPMSNEEDLPHCEHLRAVLDAASEGMVAVDDSGNILWSNRRSRELLRLPLRHAGHPLSAYVTWERTGSGLGAPYAPPSGSETSGASGDSGTSGVSGNLPSGLGAAGEFLARRTGLRHFGMLTPVVSSGGTRDGMLFTVLEKSVTTRLLAEMGGLAAHGSFETVLGRSGAVQGAIHMARLAAQSGAPVLVCGERGSGKTLFARAMHNAGTGGPFVEVDCAAVPGISLETELFGEAERPGKVELAHGGTLFLDNIEALSLAAQARLMRVLRSGELRRPAATPGIAVDFVYTERGMADDVPSAIPPVPVRMRLMAASSGSLKAAVQGHRFRPDLYYKVSPFTVVVPPLRERPEDIPLLATQFVRRFGDALNRTFPPLPPKTVDALLAYSWPGNVRELECAAERAVYRGGGALAPEHFGLPASPHRSGWGEGTRGHFSGEPEFSEPEYGVPDGLETLEALEAGVIARRVRYFNGNMSRAAASLGISRPTLYRKLRNESD